MHADLPIHPRTGLTALGVLPSGRIVWPVLGGDGNGDGGDGQGGQGGGDGGEGRTFTQAELDAILGDRLARERAKYADYEDLKGKATKYDEHQASQQTDLEKLQGQYEDLLGKNARAEHDLRIQRAISKHKLSPDDAEFLTGETDEEVDARAAKLAARTNPAGGDNGGGNGNNGDGNNGRRSDPSMGRGSNGDGASSVAAGRERYRSRFGSKTTNN